MHWDGEYYGRLFREMALVKDVTTLLTSTLNGHTRVRITATDGLLQVLDHDGRPMLSDCRAAVQMSDGSHFSTENAEARAESDGHGLIVTSPGSDQRPELRWHILSGEDGDSLRCRLEVTNTMGHPLAVERLDVLVVPNGYRRADGSYMAAAQTGWQSWSVATPPVVLPLEAPPPPPPVISPMLPPTEAERTLLPWMTLLHTTSRHSLLAGFVTAFDQAGILSIQLAHQSHRFVASSYAEGVPLAPGETRRSEELLLIFDRDDPAALDAYARELAATMQARPWPHVPTGWCSWYYFFTTVSEEDVLRNLETLSAEGGRMPLEYVQLDDGYQTHIGDWLTLNEKFPNGMRFLTDAIRSRGYKPGLWLAPFLVGEDSDVYREHPDWLLRDHIGEPVKALHNWGCWNYALDLTHPEVQEWLRHVTDTIVNDWGYDYLKIDFIYAGTLRGNRYNNKMTGIQAYRRGLEIIREVAGDRFVLGCGAPFAPSVGLVDGMRVGPDTAPVWSDERDRYGSAPGLHNAVRSTLAHGWMHRRLWTNDPDCLLVRERDSDLTLAEAQTWTTVIGLSGGLVFLSDDVSRLEPERAAMIPLVLPPLGEAAVPLGPYVDGISARMTLPIERPWARWMLAAVFNWEDAEQEHNGWRSTFDPVDWGLSGDEPYHLFDFWTGTHSGPHTGAATLEVTPPHGVRLLTVHPDQGRPQLVGSTLHLLGGAVEVAGESWGDGTLTLELACPGEHDGELVVYVPGDIEFGHSDGHSGEVLRHDHTLRVPIRLVDRATVVLHFTGAEE